ncbi:MAG: iron-containing redox enzyme family protein [Pseudonocardiaceae bacterium]
MTFLLAQLVYTARTGRHLGAALRFARAHLGEMLLLNVLTLASWLFMFMALQRIEASVESAVYQGAVAVAGFLLAALLTGQRFSRATVGGMAAATALLGLLVLARLESLSSPLPNGAVGEGLALALVAGATGGCYIYRSSGLHRRTQVSAMTVLCLRFVLLLCVTGAFSVHEVLGLSRSDPDVIARLLALSVAFVVVPTFLLQYAIARLPSVRVSAATPFVPIIALGSEYAVRPWGSAAAPVIVMLASLALIFTNRRLSRDFRGDGRPSIERNPQMQDTITDGMATVEQIKKMIDDSGINDNQFYKTLQKEPLPLGVMKEVFQQYYLYIRTFPGILSGLAPRVDDELIRMKISRTVVSELGDMEGDAHFLMFEKALAGIGVELDDYRTVKHAPETEELVATLRRLFLEESPNCAIGAHYVIEEFGFPMIVNLYEGFRLHPGWKHEDYLYFYLRILIEADHVDWIQDALLTAALSETARTEILRGAAEVLDVLNAFWKGLNRIAVSAAVSEPANAL